MAVLFYILLDLTELRDYTGQPGLQRLFKGVHNIHNNLYF